MALSDLIASNGLRPQGFAAVVSRAPASADDTLDVTWITLTGEVAGEQAVRWAGRGVLPAEGDDALLIMDSRGDPWAVCWPSGLTSGTGPEAFHYVGTASEPTFANGWVNWDTNRPAGFYRHDGRVYLTGLIKSGTVGAAAFTLPAGYLPVVGASAGLLFSTYGNGLLAEIAVSAAGLVQVIGGSNAAVGLENISFRHA